MPAQGPIQALGYVGFGSADLDGWRQFGTGLVGLQAVERSPSLLSFRMDDRKQRIVIDRAMPDGARFFGWELADAAALDQLAARLEAAKIDVTAEPQTLADNRRVRGLISFRDPAGNRLEAFYGAEIADTPFSPGRSISGFRTGPLGVGHAVLTVENIDTMMAFYVDVLGFGLSDYIEKPFRAYFFHVNARHHSLALIETGKNGMHHLMVELFSLDDVGQCYDIALTEPERVNVTLGTAHQRSHDVVLCQDTVVVHGRVRLGRPRYRTQDMAAVRDEGRPKPVGPRARLAAARRPRSCARDANARGSERPARPGAGHGRQLQAVVGDMPVVGWRQRQGVSSSANTSVVPALSRDP